MDFIVTPVRRTQVSLGTKVFARAQPKVVGSIPVNLHATARVLFVPVSSFALSTVTQINAFRGVAALDGKGGGDGGSGGGRPAYGQMFPRR